MGVEKTLKYLPVADKFKVTLGGIELLRVKDLRQIHVEAYVKLNTEDLDEGYFAEIEIDPHHTTMIVPGITVLNMTNMFHFPEYQQHKELIVSHLKYLISEHVTQDDYYGCVKAWRAQKVMEAEADIAEAQRKIKHAWDRYDRYAEVL